MRLWKVMKPLVVVCAGYAYHGYDLEVTNEQDSEGELWGKEYVDRLAMMVMTPFNGYDPLGMTRLWTGDDAAMNGYETLGGRYVDHLAMVVMTPFNGNEPFGGRRPLRLWTDMDVNGWMGGYWRARPVNGYDASMDGYETLGGALVMNPITVMIWRLLPSKTLKDSSEERIRWSSGYEGYEPSGGYSAFGGYERLWCGYDRIWNPGYELVMIRLWTDMKPLELWGKSTLIVWLWGLWTLWWIFCLGGYERLWYGYEQVMMRLWSDLKPRLWTGYDAAMNGYETLGGCYWRSTLWKTAPMERARALCKERKKEAIYQEISSGNVVNKIPNLRRKKRCVRWLWTLSWLWTGGY